VPRAISALRVLGISPRAVAEGARSPPSIARPLCMMMSHQVRPPHRLAPVPQFSAEGKLLSGFAVLPPRQIRNSQASQQQARMP